MLKSTSKWRLFGGEKRKKKKKKMEDERIEELRLAKERVAMQAAFEKEQEDERRRKEEDHKRELEAQMKAKRAQKERERLAEEAEQKRENERIERERMELQARYEEEVSGNPAAHVHNPPEKLGTKVEPPARVAKGAASAKGLFGEPSKSLAVTTRKRSLNPVGPADPLPAVSQTSMASKLQGARPNAV